MEQLKRTIEIEIDEYVEFLDKKTRLDIIAEKARADQYMNSEELLLIAGEPIETTEKQEEE